MRHRAAEASRLHVCCSNMVQISMCGTVGVRLHCTVHWLKYMTILTINTLMAYSSFWSMGRALTHWIIITRIRSMWHHDTAASEPHDYCSSMAQMSIS